MHASPKTAAFVAASALLADANTALASKNNRPFTDVQSLIACFRTLAGLTNDLDQDGNLITENDGTAVPEAWARNVLAAISHGAVMANTFPGRIIGIRGEGCSFDLRGIVAAA